MLRIHVRVIPNAGKNSIVQEKERLKIKVTAPAIEGKANKAVIDLLADHFKVRKTAINIVKGDKGRDKVVEINTD